MPDIAVILFKMMALRILAAPFSLIMMIAELTGRDANAKGCEARSNLWVDPDGLRSAHASELVRFQKRESLGQLVYVPGMKEIESSEAQFSAHCYYHNADCDGG